MPISIIELTDETGEWEIPALVTHADIFLVGAGGGGLSGGGGGGYTGTWLFVKLDEVPGYNNGKIPFAVGRGGFGRSGDIDDDTAGDGGYTRFGSDDTYQVEGGKGAFNSDGITIREGGDGGSGGGASASTNQTTGTGGSDGDDGGAGQRGNGGQGQGTTTRAFDEPEGELHAGGGGAGNFGDNGQPGGDGGGGDGGSNAGSNTNPAGSGQNGEDGKGGGGGGKGDTTEAQTPGRGGHGKIRIRYTEPN